jgi:DNA primase catalytic core
MFCLTGFLKTPETAPKESTRMPLVPDDLKERLKREVSIQRLAEARGIKLQRHGKELIGLCPFHDDHSPSLNIDPAQNVWHCKGACGEGGDVIKWVMRAEGVSFKHALELLKRDYQPTAGPPPKISTVPKLPPLFMATADDKKLLRAVVDYYHQTLKQTPEAQQYLVKRGLQSAEMLERFRLGYSNRTLGYHLPEKNRIAGAEQRGRLKALGVLRNQTPGHEHFRGSLVIPIFNLDGDVVQMYGRKIRDDLRAGTEYHLYLPGPRCGVWNEEALIASKDVILCEALIDALTFWCADYRNVTTSYGVNGFNDYHRAAFQKHGTRRVYIAYDRDEAGDKAAVKHAEELMQMGIECFRVQFPKGQDANQYAAMTQPAAKALGVLLNGAAWMGTGKRPSVAVIEQTPAAPILAKTTPPAADIEEQPEMEPMQNPEPPPPAEAKPKPAAKEKIAIEPPAASRESVFSLAAVPIEIVPVEEPAPRPMPMTTAKEPVVKTSGEEINVIWEARTYRVLGLEKNTSRGALKVNVCVSGHNARGELLSHGDTFDMEMARQRMAFAKLAAHELAVKEDAVQREVGKLWTTLQEIQRQQIKQTQQETPEAETMTAEERTAALELLRDPRLLERVLADFGQCGVVGEETNKKVSYLAAVSRLLDKPLAIVVQSSSSAGKSSLMDAVLDFMPEEHREQYSAMTGQALFYMGQKDLKHKILAVAEEEGASRAAYALKLLQSEGVLKIASTGKDPVSGKLVTHEYTVEGPVMIFLTTTAQEVDEELLNRSIVLTVNEEREQTRAIHQKQREARTTDGLWARRKRARIIELHRNAQRLLRPVAVANNIEDAEAFPDYLTRTRRDHMKLLTLIEAIALLHQYQREIKTDTRDGDTLEYIEATTDDVKLAKQLIRQVLTPSLDELPTHTRRLLLLIEEMVSQECERLQIERSGYRFTRRTVREHTRWGDTQLRVHLHRLEEMEYLILRRGGGQGQTFVYQLRCDYDGNFAGETANFAGVEGNLAGTSRPLSGGAKSGVEPVNTRLSVTTSRNSENTYKGSGAGGDGKSGIVTVPQPPAKPNGRVQAAGAD